MKIYVSNLKHLKDITQQCFGNKLNDNVILIPSGNESRKIIYGSPIHSNNNSQHYILINHGTYIDLIPPEYEIRINVNTFGIKKTNISQIENNLKNLQKTLQLKYGDFTDEFPEQMMAFRYIKPENKVLEIGGNIGRNSLIIASLLNDNSNLLTLECDSNIAQQLKTNRDLNNMSFKIEASALSKQKLIQKGWDTIPSDVLLPDYKPVKTITLEQIMRLYQIQFDTLVLDCEGAFYYILKDMPEILNGINLIIMENDYYNIEHKNYVDDKLKKSGFYRHYREPGGWGPCLHCFFEVWVKG